jgi:NAD(P)-dependent dehydrogenase (short-subunit alcohol dehydrogenase family)
VSKKVFLVTGSSRGFGRAIVTASLEAGHKVLATARTPSQLDGLVATWGSAVAAFPLDINDARTAQEAVQEVVRRFGRLDVLVNNAGYANVAAFEDSTMDDFRGQVETNLFGVVNVIKAALPVMREQKRGHIVIVSSAGTRMPSVGLSAHLAAKFALSGVAEVLAQEVAPLGIAVTALEPGGLRTDWAGSSMTIAPVSEQYDSTVGARVRLFEAHKPERGDPAKAARVLLEVIEAKDPPVRLLIGSDAVEVAERAAQARAEVDARWRALSASTDFDAAKGNHGPKLRR